MIRRHWKLLAYAATLGVIVLCFLPGKDIPSHHIWKADKFFHALAFFVVGFAWHRAGLGWRKVLMIGLLLAAGTEMGQSLLGNGRQGDPMDVLADLAGLVAGVLFSAKVRRAAR